ICIADAPIARARGGASCVPPAIEMCAPRSSSSSQTGAIHAGSFALSVFGLNAGFFVVFFATTGMGFLAGFFFADAGFFALAFFAGFFFFFAVVFRFAALLRVEFRRL